MDNSSEQTTGKKKIKAFVMTSTLVDEKMGSKISKRNMPKGKILGLAGYVPSTKVAEYGGRLEYLKDKTVAELVKIYMDNPGKYIGIAISYCDGFVYMDKYPSLSASIGFGIEPAGYPVNHQNTTFKEDLNQGLIKMRHNRTIRNTCISYYGDVEGILVCGI